MDPLDKYIISYVGLKEGKHEFTYQIDDKFFEHFQYHDFESIQAKANLLLIKKQNLMELFFDIQGVAKLACDISNEIFEQPIANKLALVVKFGEVYNEDLEGIVVLPFTAHELNVAQYIYEAIALALPIKRIHPGVKDGTLESEVLEKLKEYEIRKHQDIDPRWDKLNELLISKETKNGTSKEENLKTKKR